jgi:hypothetical protein
MVAIGLRKPYAKTEVGDSCTCMMFMNRDGDDIVISYTIYNRCKHHIIIRDHPTNEVQGELKGKTA